MCTVSSAHLDDVCGNNKFRWFAITLFAGGARCPQTKDPLHLVPQTLLALLFIHGPSWSGDPLRRLGLRLPNERVTREKHKESSGSQVRERSPWTDRIIKHQWRGALMFLVFIQKNISDMLT